MIRYFACGLILVVLLVGPPPSCLHPLARFALSSRRRLRASGPDPVPHGQTPLLSYRRTEQPGPIWAKRGQR
jgi:hypothetical protein